MSNKKKLTSDTFTLTPVRKHQIRIQAVVDLFLEVMIVNKITAIDAMNALEFILNGNKPRIRNKECK